jgi:hypothetical protein
MFLIHVHFFLEKKFSKVDYTFERSNIQNIETGVDRFLYKDVGLFKGSRGVFHPEFNGQ